MKNDSEHEELPVVDENGNVTGAAKRSAAHLNKDLLHPVVHMHIITEKRLFLQKRPDWKKVQPGKWDTAVGGHIGLREVPLDAVKREALEELGVKNCMPQLVHTYVWESDIEREYVYMYLLPGPVDIRVNQDECASGRFWDLVELGDAIKDGRDITPNAIHEIYKLIDRGLL